MGHVDRIILSHYHSDHYAGIFDFAMTGTIRQKFGGRNGPYVHGPPGIERIAEGAWIATGPDRDIRVADNEIDPEHMRIVPHLYEEGVVYDQGGLVVRAIEVDRVDFIDIAYGFRVEYQGRVFVHSHDTRYNENLIAQAHGADVFVHEVAAARQEVQDRVAGGQAGDGTSRLSGRSRPGLCADEAEACDAYASCPSADPVSINEVMAELAEEYDGTVMVAEDLLSIEIGRNISVIPFHRGAKPDGGL